MGQLTIRSSGPSKVLRQVAAIPSLYQAWRKVRANRGAPGVDAVSLQAFEQNLQPNLSELARNLLNKTYEPLPARYVNVPKSNGKDRELAIPTVRDRIAQRAVLDHIEPLIEPLLLDCSYAFRPGRSVEMAIQRIIVARAQGFRWTVDADIKDFFPSINHRLLLQDLSRTIDDSDTLRLIELWLDAGVLDGSRPSARWIKHWRSSIAGANMAVRDAVGNLLDEFLSNRLGVERDLSFSDPTNGQSVLIDEEVISDSSEISTSPRKSGFGRAATRRLLQDGLLLAIAERAALRGAFAAKLLGIGGAAFLLAAAAPAVIRKLRETASPKTGALQGAPISPLLSNIYLHPFDLTFTEKGYRLVRYCDDFLILCRSEAEAQDALRFVETSLQERLLQLNPEKTRLVTPDEEFDFLGYHFNIDGSIIPPPSVPEIVTNKIVELADRYRMRIAAQAQSTSQKTRRIVTSVGDWIKKNESQ
jgi:RNA-directed DNA polymerase